MTKDTLLAMGAGSATGVAIEPNAPIWVQLLVPIVVGIITPFLKDLSAAIIDKIKNSKN